MLPKKSVARTNAKQFSIVENLTHKVHTKTIPPKKNQKEMLVSIKTFLNIETIKIACLKKIQ
jgi:hypothetical protein